jgi:hypothetical protein
VSHPVFGHTTGLDTPYNSTTIYSNFIKFAY